MAAFVPGQGIANSTYVVPPGQNLVVTDVQISVYGAGSTWNYLRQNTAGGPIYVNVYYLTTAGTQQFHYTAGLVFPAGSSVVFQNANGSASWVDVTVQGYLSAN